MKKIINITISLIVLFAIGSTSIFAAFTESLIDYSGDAEIFKELADEQKRHYIYNHLSIETEATSKTYAEATSSSFGNFSGTSSQSLLSTILFGNMSSYSRGVAYSETNSRIDWIPYYGAERISKLSFFNIVGAFELEKDLQNRIDQYQIELKEYERQKRTKNILGYTALGVGLALTLAGTIMLVTDTSYGSMMLAGGVIGGLGSTLALLSIIPLVFVKISRPVFKDIDVSMSLAIGLANDYNHKLLTSYN